jgi:hypothetical protein
VTDPDAQPKNGKNRKILLIVSIILVALIVIGVCATVGYLTYKIYTLPRMSTEQIQAVAPGTEVTINVPEGCTPMSVIAPEYLPQGGYTMTYGIGTCAVQVHFYPVATPSAP